LFYYLLRIYFNDSFGFFGAINIVMIMSMGKNVTFIDENVACIKIPWNFDPG